MPAYILYRGVNGFGFPEWRRPEREDHGLGNIRVGSAWNRIRTAEMKIGSSWVTISDYPNSAMAVGQFTVPDQYMEDVSLMSWYTFWQNYAVTSSDIDNSDVPNTPVMKIASNITGSNAMAARVYMGKTIRIAAGQTFRVTIEARRLSGAGTVQQTLTCIFGNRFDLDLFQPSPTRYVDATSTNLTGTFATYTADFSSNAGETFVRPGFLMSTPAGTNGSTNIRRFRFQRLT